MATLSHASPVVKPMKVALLLYIDGVRHVVEWLGREPGDGALRSCRLMVPGSGTFEVAQLYGGSICCDCDDAGGNPTDEPCRHGRALIEVGLFDLPPELADDAGDPDAWPAWTDEVCYAPTPASPRHRTFGEGL